MGQPDGSAATCNLEMEDPGPVILERAEVLELCRPSTNPNWIEPCPPPNSRLFGLVNVTLFAKRVLADEIN